VTVATDLKEKVVTAKAPRTAPRRGAPLWSIGLVVAVLLVIAGAVAWRVHSASVPLTVTAAAGASNADVPRMTAATAKRLVDSGQAVMLDTRGEPYFSQLHVAGASVLTADQVEEQLPQLPTDKWLILYCT
jgi:hypothetical protein